MDDVSGLKECIHDAAKHQQVRTGLVGTSDGLATLVHFAPQDVLKGADFASLPKTVRREIMDGFPELSAKAYRQLKREITLENKVEESKLRRAANEEAPPVLRSTADQEDS